MADHVYKIIEVTGTSTTTEEDAIRNAIEKSAETIRHMRWFQVTDTRGAIENGKVSRWQVSIKIGFTLEESRE